ncbi:hypothetical protein CBL_21191, partial [Carabus blaptoides fortunei]
RAILILDNAPSHPPAQELKTSDGNIFVMYMPPNVTPLIQPMDQNVLKLTKLFYRKNLVTWNQLNPTVIKKCWNNLLLHSNAGFDEEDEPPLSELRRKWEVEQDDSVLDAITLLGAIEPQEYTSEDIEEWNRDIAEVEEDVQDCSEESENEYEDHEENKVSHPAAMEALQT